MKTHGRLRYASGYWGLLLDPHVAIRAKRMFPRASQEATGWIAVKATPEMSRDVEWLVQRFPLRAEDGAFERLAELADEHRATEAAVEAILSGQARRLEYREPARPAREYQLVAADLALRTGRLLLADELGLGKSMSALLVLREPEALPALVVCPTHLPRQWQDELEKTLPWLRSHVLRRGTPYSPRHHPSMYGEEPDVLICGYSKLRGWGDHLAGLVRTVIFDEAQELRRRESQKWEAAALVAAKASFRVGLSATPVYNYAGEIHSVMEVLAPGTLGTRSEFLREWSGHETGFSGQQVTVRDSKALGAFLRSEGLMLRRTRVEVGRELPEVVRVPHSIDSDAAVFEELAEEAVELAEMIVARDGTREELFLASGEFDWKMRQATGIAKAPYVAEFVRMLLETDEQVVLFGWHRAVYEIWLRRLKEFGPALYTGSESPAAKDRSRDAFLSGDARVLLMSLRSGAGLDGLQEAAHVAVFGELDWSPGMHDQCIGRLHRDGQGDPVVAYFLVSEQGADPVMAEVLNLKRQSSRPLTDPDAPLLEPAGPDPRERVRALARDVLARRRVAPAQRTA